jgi:large subunit ribosomal protein L4
MKLNVIKIDGTKAGDFTADKSVFGIAPNSAVVRQAILAELANMRQGTHATKNRAMVNGGGKKPWKQKGRGVARAGTTRSPIWRGGGVVFGPEPHGYSIKLPKKVGKLARRSLLSSKASDGRLVIIDELTMESHKTSDFVTILKKLGLDGKKITILITGFDQNLDRATRNLKNIYMVEASKASAYDLIDCEVVLIDKTSVTVLTNILKQ